MTVYELLHIIQQFKSGRKTKGSEKKKLHPSPVKKVVLVLKVLVIKRRMMWTNCLELVDAAFIVGKQEAMKNFRRKLLLCCQKCETVGNVELLEM